jgi:hypothetical protein
MLKFSLNIQASQKEKSKMWDLSKNRGTIERESLDHFIKIGLIEKKVCSKCDRICEIRERKRSSNAKNSILTWRCMKCSTCYSMYDGSFFGNFKKPLFEILSIIKCWSAELSVVKSLAILGYQDTKVSLIVKLNSR